MHCLVQFSMSGFLWLPAVRVCSIINPDLCNFVEYKKESSMQHKYFSGLRIIIISSLLFSSSVFAQGDFYQLLLNKEYTRLHTMLSDSESNINSRDKLIGQIILANVFGNPAHSNSLIEQLQAEKTMVPDSLSFLIARTRYDNDVKLSRYKAAFHSGTELLRNFSSHYTPQELEEEYEALKIWDILQNEDAQEVHKKSDTQLLMKRDAAGLWNIAVPAGSASINFVFDTGAGISVVTESTADSLGLIVPSGRTTSVRSGITGLITNARIGVARQITLDNLVLKNVVFLIFPDSTLSFAGGAYKIHGIIGFPVIKELEEITIAGDTLTVPKECSSEIFAPNLAIDQLLPIIYLRYGSEELPFTFDTGAESSIFSEVFFRKYQHQVISRGVADTLAFSGASGSKNMQVFIMSVALTCFEKFISLPKAVISVDALSNSQGKFYGNLGQDIIKQFSAMTISFKKSYIVFQ